MNNPVEAYRKIRTHEDAPEVKLPKPAENHLQSAEDIAAAASSLGIPAAAFRGTLSFYDDLHADSSAVRVCHGTSCVLAGADALHKELAGVAPCRSVYCLGYCDRSPAVLRPDGYPVIGITSLNARQALNGNPSLPPPPDIRAATKTPIVTERIAAADRSSLDRASDAGAYEGLRIALLHTPEWVLEALEASGERGRGGAAYPTGAKWRTSAETVAPRKYIIANGDEGDPGSFIDRMLLEFDPHSILEGMAIAAYAIGAREGIVFIRSEYPRANEVMRSAIDAATAAGILGTDILGTRFSFSVRVFTAMGSYVCGEETALLNAIEGMRGEVRIRPPYPAVCGLNGMPTVVDNVETLVNVPWIMRNGPVAYRLLGTAESSGTKALCLNHGFARPGIVEVEFGVSLREVIEVLGGGPAPTRDIEAVILGGPMGSIVPREQWDVPVCYGAMTRRGISLGHGGLVAIPSTIDWKRLLLHWLEFMQHESCGKCVPCRLGSKRAYEIVRSECPGSEPPAIDHLLDLMSEASLCAFGRLMPGPMRTMMSYLATAVPRMPS